MLEGEFQHNPRETKVRYLDQVFMTWQISVHSPRLHLSKEKVLHGLAS